ncbi:hypothetical protein PV392_21900 [Streptomyces sp. ME03-5709C]|nr:hypothetical protein [Streptomyces sp. ME03-5709C]
MSPSRIGWVASGAENPRAVSGAGAGGGTGAAFRGANQSLVGFSLFGAGAGSAAGAGADAGAAP